MNKNIPKRDTYTLQPRKSAFKPIHIPLPKGEVINRLETYRDPSPRTFKWQFWRPKYGKQHMYALTDKGVYDVTGIVESQTK